MSPELPGWAREMRDLFKSGSVAQFILHGNIFDVVPASRTGGPRQLSVKAFLEEVMFESYDVVLQYDRGKGIRATRGSEDWGEWLRQILGSEPLTIAQTREPGSALELIDRYLLRTLNLRSLRGSGAPVGAMLGNALRLMLATHPESGAATPLVTRFVRYGASPRGLLGAVLTAKALALFAGRINVSFDDLAAAAPPALRHRILLNFEGEAEGIDVEDVIAEILRDTPKVRGDARA